MMTFNIHLTCQHLLNSSNPCLNVSSLLLRRNWFLDHGHLKVRQTAQCSSLLSSDVSRTACKRFFGKPLTFMAFNESGTIVSFSRTRNIYFQEPQECIYFKYPSGFSQFLFETHFRKSFGFRKKLRGWYRAFQYKPCIPTCTPSKITSITHHGGTFVTTDEPIFTPKFTVHLGVHS